MGAEFMFSLGYRHTLQVGTIEVLIQEQSEEVRVPRAPPFTQLAWVKKTLLSLGLFSIQNLHLAPPSAGLIREPMNTSNPILLLELREKMPDNRGRGRGRGGNGNQQEASQGPQTLGS
jgi:hypothetical protein